MKFIRIINNFYLGEETPQIETVEEIIPVRWVQKAFRYIAGEHEWIIAVVFDDPCRNGRRMKYLEKVNSELEFYDRMEEIEEGLNM